MPLPRLSRLLVIAATGVLALMAVDVTAGLPLPRPLVPLWKWHYEAIEFLAAGAVLLRAAHDRRERLAWSFLALGIVAAACGDLYWDISLANLSAIPSPSAADALYLSFYPAAVLDHFRRIDTAALLLAGGTIARLALTFTEYMRALARSQEEAVSDPLTGLQNRRALTSRRCCTSALSAPP